MNEMRKLMEMVENYGGDSEVYVAANLYLSHSGLAKPALAKELSKQTGLDYKIAVLLIDAIDAYEDIRESFIKEAGDPHKAAQNDAEAYHNSEHEENEYEAFVYGVEWGNSAQYNDGGYQAYELPQAYKDWVANGRKGYYDD